MQELGLVDGIITDDSDVFLFGGKNVYKNIFTEQRFVESYRSADIETELGCSRAAMVRLALLLGSDYTLGVRGVGVVHALEILAAYPPAYAEPPGLDGLADFYQWCQTAAAADKQLEAAAAAATEGTLEQAAVSCASRPVCRSTLRIRFQSAHQRAKAGWTFEPGFPSARVAAAYLQPTVDRDPAPFRWAKVEQASGAGGAALRQICAAQFGWTEERASEALCTVLAAQSQRTTQPLISSHYGVSGRRVAQIKSARMAAAIRHLSGRQVTTSAVVLTAGDMPDGVVAKPTVDLQVKPSPHDGVFTPDADDNGFEDKTTEETNGSAQS